MRHEKILIVEDETIIAEDMRMLLLDLGYDVISNVISGENAIAVAESERPDLVLMDINLKGRIDGFEAAEIIQERFDIPVIYISAFPESIASEYKEISSTSGYIPKPFDSVQIGAMVSLTLNSRRMMKSVKEAAEWAEKRKKDSSE